MATEPYPERPEFATLPEGAAEEEEPVIPFDPWPAVSCVVDGFNRLLFSNQLFGTVSWKGLPMLKWPTDLWCYQEIIERERPDVIVECGTYAGASAIFFADIMEIHGLAPDVITIDIQGSRQWAGPKDEINNAPGDRPARRGVTYVSGSSTDPAILERVWSMVGGRKCLVSLDSDHSQENVAAELEAYAPLVHAGQHLVVEDLGWTGTNAGLTGARRATETFLAANPRFEVNRYAERFLLTQQSGGFLTAIR